MMGLYGLGLQVEVKKYKSDLSPIYFVAPKST